MRCGWRAGAIAGRWWPPAPRSSAASSACWAWGPTPSQTLASESGLQVIDVKGDDEELDLGKAAQDASIIKFVNQVLTEAIELRATDVHIEPFEHELRVRYRVDGELQQAIDPAGCKAVPRGDRFATEDPQPPRHRREATAAGRPNQAARGRPRNRRARIGDPDAARRGGGAAYSAIAGDTLLGTKHLGHGGARQHGVRANPRAAARHRAGDRPDRQRQDHDAVCRAVGRSTTIDRKIITIEDPVEYHLGGINQIQVNTKAGLTFRRGPASILRHDPDVVLIGEIRDKETAEIAVQASLTGHLVFSTLHTNDAPSAATRLIDMGVEPYLVASSVEIVLAQRLVRVICPKCKTELDADEAKRLRGEFGAVVPPVMYRGAGCRNCQGTGYRGRTGIFELMVITDEIRELILHRVPPPDIRRK